MSATTYDIRKNPKLRADYLQWLELPMTKVVLSAVRAEGRIHLPDPITIRAETALTLVGTKAGYDEAIDRIETLAQAEEMEDRDIVPSYGADAIMREIYNSPQQGMPNKKGEGDLNEQR